MCILTKNLSIMNELFKKLSALKIDLDLFYAVSIETAFGGRIMLQGKISSDSIEVANKLNVPLVFHNGRGWLEGEAEGINITLCK